MFVGKSVSLPESSWKKVCILFGSSWKKVCVLFGSSWKKVYLCTRKTIVNTSKQENYGKKNNRKAARVEKIP